MIEMIPLRAEDKVSAALLQRRLRDGKYRRDSNGTLEKRCPHCRHYLPADSEFFYRHANFPDGLNEWCKGCLDNYRTNRRHIERSARHAV